MNTEIKEVEKLTPEQINKFGLVKDNYEFLTTRLTGQDLNRFNPMVVELLNLQNYASNLKLVPANEDGEFDKENIQLFTDTKKAIGAYNSTVRASSKKLKEPQTKVNKAIIAIEKQFLEDAGKVMEQIVSEFKPHLDLVAEKKAAREAKKNKALIDAASEANKQAEIEKAKNKVTQLYNNVKYERIVENVTTAASNIAAHGNKDLLEKTRNEIAAYTMESLTADLDLTLLSIEQKNDLTSTLSRAKENAKTILELRLGAIATEKKNVALEAQKEVYYTPVAKVDNAVELLKESMGDIPLPPGQKMPIEVLNDNNTEMSHDEFLSYIMGKLSDIDRIVSDRMAKFTIPDARIVAIQNAIKSINQI